MHADYGHLHSCGVLGLAACVVGDLRSRHQFVSHSKNGGTQLLVIPGSAGLFSEGGSADPLPAAPTVGYGRKTAEVVVPDLIAVPHLVS